MSASENGAVGNGPGENGAVENGFGVRVQETPQGWRVRILDPDGAVVGERACADHLEAHTYASTVRQHIYWLSAEKFREYYRV